MKHINKISCFLMLGILVFYIGNSLSKGTHSIDEYSLEFNTNINVDEDNHFIKYIKVGTTVSKFLNNISITGTNISIEVYTSSNKLKNENDKLASGDILIISSNNEIQDKYTISVNGDSNGDGSIDLIDLVQMRKHIVGWLNPTTNEPQVKSGIYYYSLDLNKDGLVDLIDLVRVRKIIVGIEVTEDEEETISYTATFKKNGASSISKTSLTCSSSNTDKCEITTPQITSEGTVIGWSTNKDSQTADVLEETKIELTKDITYYAITKRTFTATFDKTNLDYLEASSLSCDVYNDDSSCNIVLPIYNRSGYFNSFWSPYKEASSDLGTTSWSWKYFKQVGHLYELTKNTTLYPNFNHFHYDLAANSNMYKYRNINMVSSQTIGKTLFEFEEGISQTAITNFISEMKKAYNTVPWLFIPGKVFVMTEDTYSNYSIAYGLTHYMYASYGGDSYIIIDLKYDESGVVVKNAIDVNGALHELAHAWDSYYYFRTNEGRISSLSDFDTFYNLVNSKLYVDTDGATISKVEAFAGMVTNYYWHVLGKDTSKGYYALKSGSTLSTNELSELKTFIEKYINISKNGY